MSRLPARCPQCPPNDWAVVERGGSEGVARHDCKRGRALAYLDTNRGQPLNTPGIAPEEAAMAVQRLSIRMRMVPSGIAAHAEIAAGLREFVCDAASLMWLVENTPHAFKGIWPTLYEVRAFYCSHYRPRDGKEAESGMFPEGFELLPGEASLPPQIAAPQRGEAIAAAPEDAEMVQSLARCTTLPPLPRLLTPPEYLIPPEERSA